MNFKKWVKSTQTAGYNGAHTVVMVQNANETNLLVEIEIEQILCLTSIKLNQTFYALGKNST